MQVSWITSASVGDRRVSLFSIGNYAYAIDVTENGEIRETVQLRDHDYETALQEFAKVRDRQPKWTVK